jgi:hypothetical protein
VLSQSARRLCGAAVGGVNVVNQLLVSFLGVFDTPALEGLAANQALASQSSVRSVRNGQWPCLMFLYDLSLAQAFCLFDLECGAWPKTN